MSTNRSKMIAVLVNHTNTPISTKYGVQFAMYWEGDTLHTMSRAVPSDAAPRPRWLRSPISDAAADEKATVALIASFIGRKMTLSSTDGFTVNGAWDLEFTDKDNEALDDGSPTALNSLTTRVNGLFDKPVPSIKSYDSLGDVATWLFDNVAGVLKVGGDLTEFTEGALGKEPEILALEEGEEDGIEISDGKGGVKKFLSHVFWAGTGLTNTGFLRMAAKAKQFVYLSGVPGTGKTDSIHAALKDMTVHVVQCGESTSWGTIWGQWVPVKDKWEWRDGAGIKSLRARGGLGGVLLLDEMNIPDSRVLVESLHEVMTKGYLSVPDHADHPWLEPIDPTNPESAKAIFAGPEWFLIGTGNPNVPGAVTSEALMSRFTLKPEVTTNYDTVLKILGPAYEAIVTVARVMEGKRQAGEVSAAPQARELFDYKAVTEVFGPQLALSNLLQNMQLDSDREVLADVIARTLAISNVPEFRI